MSYTYPHYVPQSPIASSLANSTRGIFHHHMGNSHPHHQHDEEANNLDELGSPSPFRPRHFSSNSPRPSKPSIGRNLRKNEMDERQPLLVQPSAYDFDQDANKTYIVRSGGTDPKSSEDDREIETWSARKEEALEVVRMTIPILVTQLLQWSLVIAPVIAIGHLSTLELAASALGSMTSSVTGYAVIVGMVSALDTLLPQAWGSVGDDRQLVGLWTQRMGVVISITLIPIFFLWQEAERILLLLRQDPEVAHLAAVYLKWMCLGLPAYSFNCIIRRYYQSQGLLHVPSVIIIIVAPINALLNYILVWGPAPFTSLKLGYIGAPIATAISFNLVSLCSLTYAIFWAPRDAWHSLKDRGSWGKVFSGEALGFLVKLGMAGVGLTASEWWSWELVGLAASMLGPVTLATQSVLLVSACTSFQGPFAIGLAASVRIGNLIGAGRASQARLASQASIAITLVMSGLSDTTFLVFRHSWGYLFNNDEEVVHLVARILPLVALSQIMDGLSAITGGILRATGRQYSGALINLTGFYVFGLPTGLMLTFAFPQLHMGLLGLWIGLCVALVYISSIALSMCLTTNWEGEVVRARLRLQSGQMLDGARPIVEGN